MVPAVPTVDESLDRLHRAGWSVGDYGTASRCAVSSDNPICGERGTQAAA